MFIRRDFSTSMFFSFNCLCRSTNSLRFLSLYSSSWLWSSRVDVLEISTISDIWAKMTYTKGSAVLNKTNGFFPPASVFSSVFSNRKFIKCSKQINFYAEVGKHKTVKLISNSMCGKTILFLFVSSSSSSVTQWTAQSHFSMAVLAVQFTQRWHNKSDTEILRISCKTLKYHCTVHEIWTQIWGLVCTELVYNAI